MSAWWEGRLCAFDVETTGVDVDEARIVTAAVVLVGGGIVPEPLTWLADPGVEIPEEATAIHGITTERARAEGQPAADVITAVRVVLEVAANAGHPVVCFNARFDLSLLDRELRRHGLEPLPAIRVIDPLVIDKHLDRYRRGSRKLDAICAHRGASLDASHHAEHDALAAARLAWRIGAHGEIVRRVRGEQEGREKAALVSEWQAVRGDLDELHAAQARWAREQALGLAQHFREAGKPGADEVRTEWPLVPILEGVAA